MPFSSETSAETSLHTRLSPDDSFGNKNASCSKCAAVSAWLSLLARLHAISSFLKAQLQCDKRRCNLSARLQLVNSAASCQGSHAFQAQLKCRLSVSLQHLQPSLPLSAQLHTLSPVANIELCLETYCPAAVHQLTCNVSALLCFHTCAQLDFPLLSINLGSFVGESGAKCSVVAALMMTS